MIRPRDCTAKSDAMHTSYKTDYKDITIEFTHTWLCEWASKSPKSTKATALQKMQLLL